VCCCGAAQGPGQLNHAVFRADASPAIGGGHVTRCLALSEVLQRIGWKTSFACSPETVATIYRLRKSDNDVLVLEDSKNEPAALRRHWPDGADWLIVDHYGLDSRFEKACRPWAEKILAIDDLADRDHDCDLLMDQTLGVRPSSYAKRVPATCHILLGPDYALLRAEFFLSRWKSIANRRHRLKRVMISAGMTDFGNITARLLQASAASGLELVIKVVLGGTSPYIADIMAQTETITGATLSVDANDMADQLARCDLVIGAAGSSSWERCCMGAPSLMVQTADNQNSAAAALSGAGAAYLLGDSETFETDVLVKILQELDQHPERLRNMSEAAARICDGRGALRMAMFTSPERSRNGGAVSLRPVGEEDADRILEWQRHPETRRHARNPLVPDPTEHEEWLHDKLADPDCLLNIVLHDGAPAGLLRLDKLEDRREQGVPVHEVSIITAPAHHRQGIARAALALGRRLLPESALYGEVLEGNAASHALFQRAQFTRNGGAYTAAPLYIEMSA
jgi:UDP-2,4-diacetamido-2,4,6-trideoxy-beta-L-altropyranose hydrolase